MYEIRNTKNNAIPSSYLQTWAYSLSLENASLLAFAVWENHSVTSFSESFFEAVGPTRMIPSGSNLQMGLCCPSLHDCKEVKEKIKDKEFVSLLNSTQRSVQIKTEDSQSSDDIPK